MEIIRKELHNQLDKLKPYLEGKQFQDLIGNEFRHFVEQVASKLPGNHMKLIKQQLDKFTGDQSQDLVGFLKRKLDEKLNEAMDMFTSRFDVNQLQSMLGNIKDKLERVLGNVTEKMGGTGNAGRLLTEKMGGTGNNPSSGINNDITAKLNKLKQLFGNFDIMAEIQNWARNLIGLGHNAGRLLGDRAKDLYGKGRGAGQALYGKGRNTVEHLVGKGRDASKILTSKGRNIGENLYDKGRDVSGLVIDRAKDLFGKGGNASGLFGEINKFVMGMAQKLANGSLDDFIKNKVNKLTNLFSFDKATLHTLSENSYIAII